MAAWTELDNQELANLLIVSVRVGSIFVGLFFVFHLLLGRRHTLGHSLLALMTLLSGIGLNIVMTAALITSPHSPDMRLLLNFIPISNVFVSLSISLTLLRYLSDSAVQISTLWKIVMTTFVLGTTLLLTVHAVQDTLNTVYIRTDNYIYVFMQGSLSERFLYVCVFIPQYFFVLFCFLHLHINKQKDENTPIDVTCKICHKIDPCYFIVLLYIGLMMFIVRPLSHSSLMFSNEILINPPYIAICFMYVHQVFTDGKASHKEKDLSTV